MNEIPLSIATITLLQRTLPAQALPWVTASLRQDGLIWRSLQDIEFRARALARTEPGIDQAEAWSPAALALLALDLPHTPQRLSSDIHYPLEGRLRKKVAATARLWTAPGRVAGFGPASNGAGEGAPGGAGPEVEELAQAGLLGLALRERRRLVGSWEGLRQDFVRMRQKIGLPFSFWLTPLACLYGLVPDPQDLLVALLTPGAPDGLWRELRGDGLALHALLANPMPPEKTAEILQALLKRLSPVDGVVFLSRLAEARPALAAETAGFALDSLWNFQEGDLLQAAAPTGHHPPDPLEDLAVLVQQLHGAQAHGVAARPAQALPLLQAARETCLHLHAELTAGIALAAQGHDPAAALAAWEQAVSLAPENPAYRAGLILALLEAGRSGEARQWLWPGCEICDQDFGRQADLPLAYAAARLAAATGDIPQAREIAQGILEKSKEPVGEPGRELCATAMAMEPSVNLPPATFRLLPAPAFPELLMDLGLMEEAAGAARRALEGQPTDPDLLALEGQAWMGAGQPGAAVEVLQIGVSLAPGQPKLRRQLSAALEADGDWPAALEQRLAVAAAAEASQSGEVAQPAPDSELGTDLRALAACALKAGAPQQAMDACRKALALDGEDGLAHLFLGQALVAAGDRLAAQEHYLQATRLAPALVEPWLALARLQYESGRAQGRGDGRELGRELRATANAMDTLRAAAQALPDSAEIYLALGEACLEDWEGCGQPAPAQALAYFQRAAALGPGTGSNLAARTGLRLGQTLHKLGHLLEARQTLERAYQSEPAYPGLAHAYAVILTALGETVSALPMLARLAEDPAYANDAPLHLAYGRALLAVGRESTERVLSRSSTRILSEFHKAAEAFQRVLDLDPGCVEAQAWLAEALAADGELPAAMQAFQAAMETGLVDDPAWQARLSLGLGRAALALGQNDIAVAALQEASQADPHDPAIARSLAEACNNARLPENALQAARTALRLAPDDLETLAWFAEQTMGWIDSSGEAPGGLASKLRAEALNALARALQISPRRADLLVRLGQVQLESGDRQAALDTFHEVAASPQAAGGDLHGAALYLLELGDAAGAVTCLEKTISQAEFERSGATPSGPAPQALQILLASAYERAGNAPAALSTLEAAMTNAPGDLSLHRAKARLLGELARQGLGRPAETLACLETAIQLAAAASGPDETYAGDSQVQDLHYEAARLLRSAGDLPGALSHTNQILSSFDPANPGPYLLPARILAAELAHSMLLPERACSILGVSALGAPGEDPAPGGEASSLGANFVQRPRPRDFEYHCLRAELALDWNDEVQARESLAGASEALSGAVRADGEGLAGIDAGASPSYEMLQARLLAIQARLNILHGDRSSALEMVREAAHSVCMPPASDPEPRASEPARRALAAQEGRQSLPLAGLLSIGEAAFLLDQWEVAAACTQRAVETAPEEPLSHLSLARLLVLRAEKERLYRAVGAIRHAPGSASLDRQAYMTFERAIDAAHQLVSQWQAGDGMPGEGRGTRIEQGAQAARQPSAGGRPTTRTAPYRRSDVIQAQTIVSRWRARGQAVFQPGPQSAQALSATLAILPPNPEDVAAQIAALRLSASREGEPASGAGSLALGSGSNAPRIHEPRQGHNPPSTPLAVAFPATIAAQASRAYPQHPLVLAQLALILSTGEGQPGREAGRELRAPEPAMVTDALHAACEAASNAQPATDLWPVCHALAASLAQAAGDEETARQAMEQALACWPDEPRWQARAAEIGIALGDLEAAVAHLEEAIRLEPGYLPHFLALGRAYLQQAMRAAAAFDPEPRASDPTPKGTVYTGNHMGRSAGPETPPEERAIHQAIHSLEEACRLAPGQPEPWLALAEAQRAGGFLERAGESAGRAIDLAPGEHRPRLLRAEIALQAGDAQAAYEQITSAISLEGAASSPASGQLALLLARALDRLNRPAEALSALEKALSRASQPLPLLLERIQLLRKIHGAKAATDILQQLATQYPTEPEVLAPLAFALAEAGQEEAAIRAAQGALQAMAVAVEAAVAQSPRPSSRPAASPAALEEPYAGGEAARPAGLHALLGRLLSSAGQLDGAIHHLNEAIRMEPRCLEPYLELGRALQERRQQVQALQVYSQATQVAPRDPRPYYQAGLALKESKDYLGAENMLRRASALAPNDVSIQRQLGAVVALNLVHNRSGARQNA